MDTVRAVRGFVCLDCGETLPAGADPDRCPDCGGPLGCRYDYDAIALSRDRLADFPGGGIERYGPVLPVPTDRLVTMAEGGTPLVSCPSLAEAIGVGAVSIKDEGRNPTGTIRDRAFAIGITAAREQGAAAIALPSTGDGGQSAAAYAARAGLAMEAFVPTRSTFVSKAMTNVHGGEMSVVEGRYDDALAAFRDATADDRAPYSLAPGATPYRHEGTKTLAYEILEQRDWRAPDAVVHPTAHGESVVGVHRALEEIDALGLADDAPELHVAQPEACAPVVAAWEAGAAAPDPWERPDTLVGALEVPDPALGRAALEAVRDTGGRAVAVADDDALEAAVEVAAEGVESSATGGVGIAAVRELASAGHLGPDDDVVVVNPVAGNKENDVLRSHLMRKGI